MVSGIVIVSVVSVVSVVDVVDVFVVDVVVDVFVVVDTSLMQNINNNQKKKGFSCTVFHSVHSKSPG